MPELPEVETMRRDLLSAIKGEVIAGVSIKDERVIRHCSVSIFRKRIKEKTIIDVRRRGKAVIICLSDESYITIQPMMTGHFSTLKKKEAVLGKEVKVVFMFLSGAQLYYNDVRMFGRVCWVKDLNELSYFRTIGPEPFDKNFNSEWMLNILKRKKISIKAALLDHKVVSGVGNIYASEILFASNIRPMRKSNSIKLKEIDQICKHTVDILNKAIESRGTSMRDYIDAKGEKGSYMNRISVYGKEGKSCPRCESKIKKIVLNQRSTFYCAQCQN